MYAHFCCAPIPALPERMPYQHEAPETRKNPTAESSHHP
jgi:hypothetical protein